MNMILKHLQIITLSAILFLTSCESKTTSSKVPITKIYPTKILKPQNIIIQKQLPAIIKGQLQQVNDKLQQLSATVGLYKALGGGIQ